LVRHFCKTITSDPVWSDVTEAGVCSIPLADAWEDRPDEFTTQFVPVWTRHRYNYYLMFHLQMSGMFAFPIDPPVVPRGTGRIRLVLHAENTEAQVEALARAICEWAKEMLDIEAGRAGAVGNIPKATRKVYALMASSDVQLANPSVPVDSAFVID
jgi:8-amino-7-oxononanoate synthase